MYEQSHRDYLRSGYPYIICLSWAVNHYRDNAITYKAARSARELKHIERGKCQHGRVSVMLLPSMQNTRRSSADAKAENDALRDDVAAGRRRLHIKAVCQSVREATTASGDGWLTSPTGRHRWTGLFHPPERG